MKMKKTLGLPYCYIMASTPPKGKLVIVKNSFFITAWWSKLHKLWDSNAFFCFYMGSRTLLSFTYYPFFYFNYLFISILIILFSFLLSFLEFII